MKCSFPAILAALVISAPFAARRQNTVLLMDSDPGDYIGGGDNYYYTPGEGFFTASQNQDGGVSITFSNGSDSWSLDFAAPDAIPLQMQVYPNATRFPFQDPDEPGLSVSGQGRSCNTQTGELEIKQVLCGPIISLHAGLSLDSSSGLISGMPSVEGTFSLH